MKKSPNGTLVTHNPIEKVIPLLPDVDGRLAVELLSILVAKEKCISDYKELSKSREILRQRRSSARVLVTRDYSESEVETADTNATVETVRKNS